MKSKVPFGAHYSCFFYQFCGVVDRLDAHQTIVDIEVSSHEVSRSMIVSLIVIGNLFECILYNTLFSREENFAKSEFEIFSREDIFANILFTRKYLPAKISSRENILSRKYLPAKISSRESHSQPHDKSHAVSGHMESPSSVYMLFHFRRITHAAYAYRVYGIPLF